MLEFLILYTLIKNKFNIYEIKKEISTKFAPFIELSTGAIIPALKRLEKQECVKCEKVVSDGGLRRTIYAITENGLDFINKYTQEEIVSAPQLMRRETDVLLLLIDNEIFSKEQQKNLKQKIKTAIEKQIKLTKISIADGKMNLEYLNMELIYLEAKLRFLAEDEE